MIDTVFGQYDIVSVNVFVLISFQILYCTTFESAMQGAVIASVALTYISAVCLLLLPESAYFDGDIPLATYPLLGILIGGVTFCMAMTAPPAPNPRRIR